MIIIVNRPAEAVKMGKLWFSRPGSMLNHS